MTAPQLQEKESELKAMHQRLIHEAKEREKIEALLEQQKHFAAESAAEASARELELKKSLEAVRTNAAQELNDAKSYLSQQLAAAHASLNATESSRRSVSTV